MSQVIDNQSAVSPNIDDVLNNNRGVVLNDEPPVRGGLSLKSQITVEAPQQNVAPELFQTSQSLSTSNSLNDSPEAQQFLDRLKSKILEKPLTISEDIIDISINGLNNPNATIANGEIQFNSVELELLVEHPEDINKAPSELKVALKGDATLHKVSIEYAGFDKKTSIDGPNFEGVSGTFLAIAA